MWFLSESLRTLITFERPFISMNTVVVSENLFGHEFLLTLITLEKTISMYSIMNSKFAF